MMFRIVSLFLLLLLALSGCSRQHISSKVSCIDRWREGFIPIAEEREKRFLGKVQAKTANCRGGQKAVQFRETPWVDWGNYFDSGDASSRAQDWSTSLVERIPLVGPLLGLNFHGHYGTIVDLEYQRFELVRFNLFDNAGTYADYIQGRWYEKENKQVPGIALEQWDQMRLPNDARFADFYEQVGGDGEQLCTGELVRYRTLLGICNDVRNPRMGSTGTLFARNTELEESFPELASGPSERDEIIRNRHGSRLGLFQPDPNAISRDLLTRAQAKPELCRKGAGSKSPDQPSQCDYQKAPFMNVLAAFWIQFMVHDWFSHLDEGKNDKKRLGELCTGPDQKCAVPNVGQALFEQTEPPGAFYHDGRRYFSRARKTTSNFVTAWWDASQLYGYSEASALRVIRDPLNRARLAVEKSKIKPKSDELYLPLLTTQNAGNPNWVDQDATAFADNWNVGLSFFHNLFAREHNTFVDQFIKHARDHGSEDSGLRDPGRPGEKITYAQVSENGDLLFEIARLVVSAGIAKIHTIEWTTQLLYNEPLFEAMNANWSGLVKGDGLAKKALKSLEGRALRSDSARSKYLWHPLIASASGIFGTQNEHFGENPVTRLVNRLIKNDSWDPSNPEHLMAGVSHFGSPFNFPEEFTTVYRLHPLVPDLLEYRQWDEKPNQIVEKIPMLSTFRSGGATLLRERGMANLGFSMGRQRLGLLMLQNAPAFLQNLPAGPNRETIDTLALDIVRDRERGIPRYNEFRRQIGLKSLSGFDDFIDQRLPPDSDERKRQTKLVDQIRAIYGTHVCDASLVITKSQIYRDGERKGRYIDDCLGHRDGTRVDNIEDLDVVIGMLAETTRPHGFAISETQFQIFIANASRRLFSDRFLTSGFRPDFYTGFGVNWVTNNGPGKPQFEPGLSNGHRVEVSPLKRVLLRNIPKLDSHLKGVVNVFDPWARDRGKRYSLAWRSRAEIDDPDSMPGGTGWQESVGAGEKEQFARISADMAALVREIQEHEGADRPHRPQHAKMLAGTDNAQLTVSENMPAELQNKLFRPGATYPVTLRFSNAAATINPDEAADLRGIALRIYRNQTSHDLLMTNAPLHHARDAAQAMVATEAFATRGKLGGVLHLVRELGVFEGLRIARTLKRQSARSVESLATETFWSRAPFQINGSAVKFRLVPTRSGEGRHSSRDLGQELTHRLAQGPVEYRLEIQWFQDEQETPLELGTADWGDAFFELGTLTIPRQDLGSPKSKETQAQIDAMQFNPWYGDLNQLKPLGRLNRVRDPVYRASSSARAH